MTATVSPRTSPGVPLLAIDVGNSHIRLGLFGDSGDPDSLREPWRVRTSPATTGDELALTVRGLLADDAATLGGIVAQSVVPSVTGELRDMAVRHWPGVPAVVVAPGVRTGVPLLVENPHEVGSDRVVNALAAHELTGGAAIVVNVDTATTVDAISPRGELLGGAFAPGIDLSVDALADRAAGLRKIELVRPRSVLGRTTVTALQAGVVIGVAGQIDALVDRLRAEVDGLAGAPVVLTGGRAALVAPESRTAAEVRPHLGLEGLRSVFCRNRR